MTGLLPPLPVAAPLALAALLLGASKALPSRAPDLIATATALGAGVACAAMAVAAASAPLTYWFGGWQLLGQQVVGISFVVDQASAILGALVSLLFAATFVFAWGFFAKVHAHFHVLMLGFMAGMIGFCLAGDLFDMFVWLELMSVAGFAATGYELRPASIAGALNFTVVNTVGSYLFLGGIGLLYGQLGALDLRALGQGVSAHPNDPVVTGAFALLAAGLLIKAAQVPFQMWLGDAHAVAPSPVAVIFSGAEVGVSLFGLAKLVWQVFAASPATMHVAATLLLGMGLASALVGGAMALAQRHVKRLLAFSTISHAGVMLAALSLLRRDGSGGMLAYLSGHGFIKASMFMIAGFMAAKLGGIDEVELRGRGRPYWPMGLVMAAGGMLLAGLPLGTMDEGFELIASAAEGAGLGWITYPILVSSALTGAAVLRVAGRVFAGWGESVGEEQGSASDEEQETDGKRPWPLLAAPAVFLLGLAAVRWDGTGALATRAAAGLMHAETLPSPALSGSAGPWVATAAALVIAAYNLGRRRLPGWFTRALDVVGGPPLQALRAMHSGLVTDYVAWITVGLALFSLAFLLA